MEKTRAIELVRKLLNMNGDNGCSEKEAFSYMAKAGDIIQQFNISMDQLFLDTTACVLRKIDIGCHNRQPVDKCHRAIARFVDCKYWVNQSRVENTVFCYFGLPKDTEMAEHLYVIICSAMATETAAFKESAIYRSKGCIVGQGVRHRRKLVVSFQKAFAIRVNERLDEMTKNRHAAEKEQTHAKFSGIGVSTDIVLLKQNKVKDEFDKLGVKLHNIPATRYQLHDHASRAGHEAGNNVNLNRPIQSGHAVASLQGATS